MLRPAACVPRRWPACWARFQATLRQDCASAPGPGRRSEVLNLRWRDLDLEGRFYRYTAKGGKERQQVLPQPSPSHPGLRHYAALTSHLRGAVAARFGSASGCALLRRVEEVRRRRQLSMGPERPVSRTCRRREGPRCIEPPSPGPADLQQTSTTLAGALVASARALRCSASSGLDDTAAGGPPRLSTGGPVGDRPRGSGTLGRYFTSSEMRPPRDVPSRPAAPGALRTSTPIFERVFVPTPYQGFLIYQSASRRSGVPLCCRWARRSRLGRPQVGAGCELARVGQGRGGAVCRSGGQPVSQITVGFNGVGMALTGRRTALVSVLPLFTQLAPCVTTTWRRWASPAACRDQARAAWSSGTRS
jgi:hypothetical protein